MPMVFFSFSHGLAASKSVNACGACHVMSPWVNDLRDPKSESLAATHFKNRYIQTEQWVIGWSNTLRRVVTDGYGYEQDRIMLDLAPEIALAGTPSALVDHLNALLFAGMMTADQRSQMPEDTEVTAADRLIVESPTLTGLIIMRALAAEPGAMATARGVLAAAQCRVQPQD